VTGGHSGMVVPGLQIFGVSLSQAWQQYYLDLVFAALVVWGASNLFRTPTGRAFLSVRDSELSARCLGVNVEWVKIQSFGVSAAITGLAGALFAHHLTYLVPDVFGVLESLKLMLMIVVGGLGSILGAILGAVIISILPIALSFLKDVLPPSVGQTAGLEPLMFGLIIVLVIVFEPLGIYGRWMKFRFFFETFPYYRKSSFVRQKTYLKTERMR
jgi:branched-chain amino acid transport system permease protein